MGLVITSESELGREMAKWNKPYVFAEFPQRLSRASRAADGVVNYEEIDVRDEHERRNMQSRGFVIGRDVALAALEKSEDVISDLTAERHAGDRKMSPMAQREARAADQATDRMVPEVPRTPVKRGRPKKAASVAAAGV